MTAAIHKAEDGLNILIWYGYDGTDFAGSQIQPGKRTVSGELESVLAGLYGRTVKLIPSSRTDKGVHARKTAASAIVFPKCGPGPERLVRALSAKLPRDILVSKCETVPAGFNARFAASRREYRYRFRIGKPPEIHEARFCARIDGGLNIDLVRKAVSLIPGACSFKAFSGSGGGLTSGICRIFSASFRLLGTRGEFRIEADRFLHQMVRRLAGSIFAVGRGELEMRTFESSLFRGTALPRVFLAPPEGLFLWRVLFERLQNE
ncbi:MAG: hypothetical protein HRF49_04260 [bacterium]|jgi:tRNA pseudouridine38-40 synthase